MTGPEEPAAPTVQQVQDFARGAILLALVYELVKPRPARPRRWWQR
jgi:hypothetical protein